MNELQVTAALLVLALAAFVQGVFGLGFAMIATPLLALFLDYQTAVMVAAVGMAVTRAAGRGMETGRQR